MRPDLTSISEPSPAARVSPLDLLLTLAFIAMFYVQLAHHQMWRDELNAWGIVVASHSVPSLFHHIHYEGHPWLWYVLLWIPSHFTASPIGMRLVEGLVGTGIYLLIGLASPFSRGEKLLLFLSYFVSFEYTVMNRMYGVGLLLALVYAWRRSRYPERVVGNAALIGLIASTDLTGIIISGGLVCEYAWTLWKRRRENLEPQPRQIRIAALTYALITAFSIWSLKPTSDVSWRTTTRTFIYAASIRHLFHMAVTYTVLAFFPVNFGKLHWWNPDFTDHRLLYVIAFPLILFALYLSFRKRPNLLLAVGVTLLGGTAFGHLIYSGSTRHYGMTFVAFVFAIWLLRAQSARLPVAAIALLTLCAVAGVISRVQEWRRPFSNAQAAAAWIRQNHLEDEPLAGIPDTSVASVAEILERPIYQPECQCSDTFLLFGSRRDHFTMADAPDRIAGTFPALHTRNVLFVMCDSIAPDLTAALAERHISIQPLAQFTGAEVPGEDFYLYHLQQSTP